MSRACRAIFAVVVMTGVKLSVIGTEIVVAGAGGLKFHASRTRSDVDNSRANQCDTGIAAFYNRVFYTQIYVYPTII
jgi:hypothetical protein